MTDIEKAKAELKAAFPAVEWEGVRLFFGYSRGKPMCLVGRHSGVWVCEGVGRLSTFGADRASGSSPAAAVRSWLNDQPWSAFMFQGGEK